MNLDINFADTLARLNLENETCGLKHSKEDPAENHKAVNYLVQNIGNPQTGEIFYQLRIPVCEECFNALDDNDWILMYCVNCNKSQWVYKPYAKYQYPSENKIYWLDVCPFCAEIANEYKEEE